MRLRLWRAEMEMKLTGGPIRSRLTVTFRWFAAENRRLKGEG